MSEYTVSAGYARALVEFAVSRGADARTLAERCRIDLGRLENPDNRLAFDRFKALMRAAKDLCGDPALPLRFGAESQFVDMSIVGLICYAADTMGEAFVQMNRYARLVVEVAGHESGERFATLRGPDGLWIVDRRRNPNDFPELTESTFARFINDTARSFGDIPFAKAVYVTHPEPAHRAEYDRILRVPVVFESDRNAILADESWLSIKITKPNRYTFGIFRDRADELLERLERSKTMRGQVESALLPILHTGELGMAEVARKMGLSRTSLYRKLKAEGVGYDEVVDDLRQKMALHYLNDRKTSVNQTAYLVGFSDPSAFSRAFKRWTGTSPKMFRENGRE